MSPDIDDAWREQAEQDLKGLVAALEEIYSTSFHAAVEHNMTHIGELARAAISKHGTLA